MNNNIPRKVIGIGEMVLDLIFRNGQPQCAAPGGSVFNSLVSLSRCAVPALFAGELGCDAAGDLIRLFMDANRLPTNYIEDFVDGQTPVSLAVTDDGQAAYAFYGRAPARRRLPYPPVEKEDVVLFGSYYAVRPDVRAAVRRFLQEAHAQQAILYYDINFRKAHAAEREALLPHFLENFAWATVVRCSDEDLAALFPQRTAEDIYAEYFLPSGKCLIITQGERAIRRMTPEGERTYPVSPVSPASTVGAGDAFNAGWAYGIVQQKIPTASLGHLPEKQWDLLMASARSFAAAACLSWENYVPRNFLAESIGDSGRNGFKF
jgi:fructokinase